MAELNTKTGKSQKMRSFGILIIFTLIASSLLIRTAWLQIGSGEALSAEAMEQQTRDRPIYPKRGTIFDRNGKTLAVSATVSAISITPIQIRESGKQELVAEKLAEILSLKKEDILKKIERKTAYESVKRKVETEQAEQVRTFISENKIPGIKIDEDSKRYYPFGNFASHIIGFTGADNQGLDGLESVFDDELKGKAGRVIAALDASGSEMPFKYEKYINPEEGSNVVLTIDEAIQHFTEKHLETAVVENKLKMGAAAIVMDVKTGEILAMATKPDYDLNAPMEIKNEEVKAELENLNGTEYNERAMQELSKIWRNKAVVDSYEPGSTFKIATTAIALEEKSVKLDDQFFCAGHVKVATHDISCHQTRGHGSQNFIQGVQNSCNPVFIDLGYRIGRQKFYDYFKGMGFRDKTGIELPGETSGIFFPFESFNEVEVATTSFGQGFQVTPLQMITIASAVANGGNMMKPHLVKQLTDNNGNVIKNYEPEFIRQIISKETSDMVCTILESVVSEGTGKNAYVPGFRIAGKTGTSEKRPRKQGKYIASFLGFAPADDPQIACLVVLDEPPTTKYYGGVIAAPVAKYIMEDTLRYLGVEPEFTEEEIQRADIVVPEVLGRTRKEAEKMIKELGLNAKIEGSGDVIIDQVPKSFAKLVENSTIVLYTEGAKPSKSVTIPNVLDKTPSEANTLITNAGLNVCMKGLSASGGSVVCARQTPAEGVVVEPGTVVTVEFRYMVAE